MIRLPYKIGSISVAEWNAVRELAKVDKSAAIALSDEIKNKVRRSAPDLLVYSAMNKPTEKGYPILREALSTCVVDVDKSLVNEAMGFLLSDKRKAFLDAPEQRQTVSALTAYCSPELSEVVPRIYNWTDKPHLINFTILMMGIAP